MKTLFEGFTSRFTRATTIDAALSDLPSPNAPDRVQDKLILHPVLARKRSLRPEITIPGSLSLRYQHFSSLSPPFDASVLRTIHQHLASKLPAHTAECGSINDAFLSNDTPTDSSLPNDDSSLPQSPISAESLFVEHACALESFPFSIFPTEDVCFAEAASLITVHAPELFPFSIFPIEDICFAEAASPVTVHAPEPFPFSIFPAEGVCFAEAASSTILSAPELVPRQAPPAVAHQPPTKNVVVEQQLIHHPNLSKKDLAQNLTASSPRHTSPDFQSPFHPQPVPAWLSDVVRAQITRASSADSRKPEEKGHSSDEISAASSSNSSWEEATPDEARNEKVEARPSRLERTATAFDTLLRNLEPGLNSAPRGFARPPWTYKDPPEKPSSTPHQHYAVRIHDGMPRHIAGQCNDSCLGRPCYPFQAEIPIYDPVRHEGPALAQGFTVDVLNTFYVRMHGPCALLLQPVYNKITFLAQEAPYVTNAMKFKADAYQAEGENGEQAVRDKYQQYWDQANDNFMFRVDLTEFFLTPVVLLCAKPVTFVKVDNRILHDPHRFENMDSLAIQHYWDGRIYDPAIPAAQRLLWHLGSELPETRVVNTVVKPWNLFLSRFRKQPGIFDIDVPHIQVIGGNAYPVYTEEIGDRTFELGYGVSPMRFLANVEPWEELTYSREHNMYGWGNISSQHFRRNVMVEMDNAPHAPRTHAWSKLQETHLHHSVAQGQINGATIPDLVWEYVDGLNDLQLSKLKVDWSNQMPRGDANEGGEEVLDVQNHVGAVGEDVSDCAHCAFYDDEDLCCCKEHGLPRNSNMCTACWKKTGYPFSSKISTINDWVNKVEKNRVSGKWKGSSCELDIELLKKSAKDMEGIPARGLTAYPGLEPDRPVALVEDLNEDNNEGKSRVEGPQRGNFELAHEGGILL
ncbi:hypothetical protein EJ08DRAFT_693496 [Tothia fuscella]|uniref:Uncharacterized protein n=1 Tax=Tothia fuscella TaxID=1048955 RepID=A0A9P4P007_9PEZI|nr:hypothetical protein EJ08DRAFT_693496 [Tothia fuscella]